jgi:hypothetical protein
MISAAAMGLASPATAAPEADRFGACLTRSVGTAERTLLVRWIFTSLSAHPALRDMGAVTAAMRDGNTRAVAALIDDVAIGRCGVQARQAQQAGADPIRLSFETLMRLAAGDLMANPATGAEVQGLERFIDRERWQALLSGPAR